MPGNFLTDDLSTFFNTSDFATAATYTPAGGDPVSINVIFDDSKIDIDPITGQNINLDPTVLCKKSDVSTIKPNDAFTIGSVSFKVLKPQPSTTEDTILVILNKVAT
jgi:hypothetical protein